MSLRILLAQAEVELIPAELREHKVVLTHSQRMDRPTGGLLLDANAHKPAMKSLEDANRRGRPDIAHHCLLHLLEHPTSKRGELEVAMHTRNGDLLRFNHETRLPRGEARFQGVLAKILREQPDQESSPLAWHEGNMNPQQVIQHFGEGPVIRLEETGQAMSPLQIADKAESNALTLVIGAFPSGGWSTPWLNAAPNSASIWPESLNAWVVCAELVAAWRIRHGPH